MKKILTILIVILLTSCSAYDQNISIENIGQSQSIILTNLNDKYAHAISINVTGHIDGEANIYLMLNEKPYKTKRINGNVNFKWGGDWYSRDAVIVYRTTNVTKGDLLIEYSFDTL